MGRIKKTNNKGFTLVELIVVLVILAILSAIIVPALLGYIDDAKEKQDFLDAKSVLNAVQSELAKKYARYSSSLELNTETLENCVIYEDSTNTKFVETTPPGGGKGNGDINAVNSSFAETVLELAGLSERKPWLLIIGVGSNFFSGGSKSDSLSITAQANMSLHDRYTVYYLFYWKDKNSKPFYYYNGEWTDRNPRAKNNQNKETFNPYNAVKEGPLVGKRLQYYFLSFNNDEAKNNYKIAQNSKLWPCLKEEGSNKITDIWK